MNSNKTYQKELLQVNESKIPWELLENQKILITGGTGLVGSAIVDTFIYRNENFGSNMELWILSRNMETVIEKYEEFLNKPYFHYIQQDIVNPIQTEIKMDYIIHCASKGDPKSFVKNPVGVMNSNYIGTLNILEYAKKVKAKKVTFISTGEVYGMIDSTQGSENDDFRISEEMVGTLDSLKQRNSYGISKRAAETLCISFFQQYGVQVNITRLCHIYGSTMQKDENRVIFQFLDNVLKEKDIILKSQGLQKRSYCYVFDAVIGILTVLCLGKNGEAYNVANENSIATIREMAELIARYGHKKVIFEKQSSDEINENSGIMNATLSGEKIKALGARFQYDLLTGVQKTIELIKN